MTTNIGWGDPSEHTATSDCRCDPIVVHRNGEKVIIHWPSEEQWRREFLGQWTDDTIVLVARAQQAAGRGT